jgi:transcriptional regulator with XRE-family HTH domain
MNALPAKRQAKIRARTAQLKSEYETLQELRKALNVTQEQLAADLDLSNITRLEKRHDMLLSTLARAIRAIGGKLDLTHTFLEKQRPRPQQEDHSLPSAYYVLTAHTLPSVSHWSD